MWLKTATKVYDEAYNRRSAISSRAQYAKSVDKLIGLQGKVTKAAEAEFKARAKAKSGEGVTGAITASIDMAPAKRGKKHRPKDPAHAAAWDKLEDARQALELAWLDTERANPALAAYRERGGELAGIDLGAKGMSGDARLKNTLAPIVQKLVNVHEAIAALEQGKLKPMSLKPVVRQVREDLLIPAGSTFDPAVVEGIEEAGETSWAMKIMDAVMFAISFTGVGGIAAGAYDLLKEYVKYTSDKRLSNTALDATKSISDEDPSLTGLILAAVDLGFSVNEVRAVFKEARALKKTMLEGEEEAAKQARKQLDELGESHGIDDLASDVEKREGKTAKPKREEHTTTQAAGTAIGVAVDAVEREREEFKARLRAALTGQGTSGRNPQWQTLERELEAGTFARTADTDWVLAEADKINQTVRDPDWIVKAADDLWLKSRATGKTPEKLLAEFYGGRLPILNASGEGDFWRLATQGKPFVDKTFADSAHGSFVHVFQQYVVDLRYGSGTSQRFRLKLAEQTQAWPAAGKRQMRDLVWDATYDETRDGFLNSPETIGPILNEHLGFNRARTRKKQAKEAAAAAQKP